jgi:hypothetical protein
MQRGFASDLRGVFAGVFMPVLRGFLRLIFMPAAQGAKIVFWTKSFVWFGKAARWR